MKSVLILLGFFTSIWSLPDDSISRSNEPVTHPAQTISAIINEGYPIQVHKVTTSDGYILEIHRIPFGRENVDREVRPVVFLMHGLMTASVSYIGLGSERSIAYNLADAGCDVWLGNARGNRNSRQHVTLDPDDDVDKLQFFDFTWEEIGMIDIANVIDYILVETGRDKLHYIGHSQGGTNFLVLTSMKPEYNDKIISAHLFAPAGYKEHFPNPELSTLAQFTDTIYSLAVSVGFVEIFPPDFSFNFTLPSINLTEPTLGNNFYNNKIDYENIFRELQMDTLVDEITEASVVDVSGTGAALKQIAHYGQNVRDKIFRRYDHGEDRNIELYGTSEPPAYDLSLITCNVTVHYSLSDDLIGVEDVLNMAADMPNTVTRLISRPTFTHGDFVSGSDAKELVSDYVIDRIRVDEKIYLDTVNVVDAGGNVDSGIVGGGTIIEPDQESVPGSASTIVFSNLVKLTIVTFSLYVILIK